MFVHGCFWHQHPGCRFAARPGSNVAFWSAKFDQNRRRDAAKEAELRRLGWKVQIIWECEGTDRLEQLISDLRPTVGARR